MRRLYRSSMGLVFVAGIATAQVKNYKAVTDQMLENPSPNDWLMFSRTYDAQRYSPLKQIDAQNAGQLGLAWKHDLSAGTMEGIPLVHDGVMYVIAPGGMIDALDATNGDTIWEYKHKMPEGQSANSARSKTIAIYQDVILYTAPDDSIVGIDAATGKLRWSVPDKRGHTSGPIVVQGKVVTGGTCRRTAPAHRGNGSAYGQEGWKFYTAQGPMTSTPTRGAALRRNKRTTSTWGLPGPTIGAAFDLLGRHQSYAEHAAGAAARRQYRRRDFAPPRPPTCIAIRPWLWTPPPASSSGIISTFPATIGIRITRMSAH